MKLLYYYFIEKELKGKFIAFLFKCAGYGDAHGDYGGLASSSYWVLWAERAKESEPNFGRPIQARQSAVIITRDTLSFLLSQQHMGMERFALHIQWE